jgi:hypothetical protein
MGEASLSGNMPGDVLHIGDSHRERSETIFPKAIEAFRRSGQEKFVISVFGGSGVGKSEVGYLLAERFRGEGLPAFLVSGDNYPYRIPAENDRERESRYRYHGLLALARRSDFHQRWTNQLRALWERGEDSARESQNTYPFLETYQEAGRKGLEEYLGTEGEIDFGLLNDIIHQFKRGEQNISLKKMGRTPEELWFERFDVSDVPIMILEWTHGNNERLHGVDYPVLLYSSPEETLEHRRARARDKGVDSPFVKLVLEIEQQKLLSQAAGAMLIVSKSADILKYEDLAGSRREAT